MKTCCTTDRQETISLDFRKLTLANLETVRPFFFANKRRICDSTIGNTFMWRDLINTEFAIENDVLYLRAELMPNNHIFAPPRSTHYPAEAFIDRIADYCRETGEILRFFPASGVFHEALKERFPELHEWSDSAWSDYLYDAEDLITLAGRRFSGQRNHINKFRRLYENWRFEAITPENLPQVREFLVKYMRDNVKDAMWYTEGNIKALEVLDNYGLYRQLGGVLFVGDEVAGFALGEAVGDTLFVHTEKALPEFQGAYPMIVNQYSIMYATNGVKYINREEDDGDEGLRTSKLSYHPCMMLEKYHVEI